MKIYRPQPDAYGESGEVVTVTVHHPLEDPQAAGKRRPAILLDRPGPRWRIMGLTTKPSYANGQPRLAITDPRALGLDRDGYLWGAPTFVAASDLHRHIGWVDELTAQQLVNLPGCSRLQVALLLGQHCPDAAA